MGMTPIFDLRWPELGDPSDAPDGYKDLAQDTEAALKGLRDDADDLPYTPTWRASATVQPHGMTWTARYSVRGKRCFISVYGIMSSTVGGGQDDLWVGLPVRSRSGIPQQLLNCKLGLSWGNFQGWAFIPSNSMECGPWFPVSADKSNLAAWRSSTASGLVGTGIPTQAGQYSVVPAGNFGLWGSYLI